MSAHQLSTYHVTWKAFGSRTERIDPTLTYRRGKQRPTPSINDWDMDSPDEDSTHEQNNARSEHNSTPTVRMQHTPPTCVRVTHVNVHVFRLQGIGDYIGHATSEWRLLRMMQDPRVTSTGGCSLHGTLGTSTFSGCISTHDINKALAHYR